ncbi:hypothetical protein PFDG_04045 [Plasmodium falciparum Dd2]|uniref:Uncharacterized protein n=1 Tax=Plasmodium falciparum (isolate Dd2) TaxID=57267 RepID=A0A0L7M4L9_PLAF4|nr:hypothetical protein PFDG_04045 [Plasmodium falciparum Dd2]
MVLKRGTSIFGLSA